MASDMPSLLVRKSCLEISNVLRADTASVWLNVKEPVNANNGSSIKVWFSAFLSAFLISTSKQSAVSIPD